MLFLFFLVNVGVDKLLFNLLIFLLFDKGLLIVILVWIFMFLIFNIFNWMLLLFNKRILFGMILFGKFL